VNAIGDLTMYLLERVTWK